MRRRGPGTLRDILAAIAEDLAFLAGKQLGLFRAEIRLALRRLFSAVVMAVLGLASAASMLVFLGIALFEWLVTIQSSRLMAALTVAGVAAFIAFCLIAVAYDRLTRTTLVPWRTLASLRRTMRASFKEADDG